MYIRHYIDFSTRIVWIVIASLKPGIRDTRTKIQESPFCGYKRKLREMSGLLRVTVCATVSFLIATCLFHQSVIAQCHADKRTFIPTTWA